MYRDNSLLPSDAVRLLALGLLADQRPDRGAMSYAALAGEIRHFTGRMVGPSLDLVGVPLEVLKVEGLLEASDEGVPGQNPSDGSATLRVTEAGLEELRRLLTSDGRRPSYEFSKLFIAIKMRLLHLLPARDQVLQLELMVETCERELARLEDLRGHHQGGGSRLVPWLDREIQQARDRLQWFQSELTGSGA